MPKRTCTEPDCNRAHDARGLCRQHYGRRSREGTLPPIMTRTLEERFWSHVDKSGECWVWMARCDPWGYGRFQGKDGYSDLAHRRVWDTANGRPPAGKQVDHICFNRACVRLEHLRLVSAKQNAEHRAGPNRGSASGVRNVYPRDGGWVVMIRHHGKLLRFGKFADLREADAVAQRERARLFTHA